MAFLYPWNGSSVAIWIPERNCSPRSSSQFLYTVPDLPGTRSTQAGRGVVLPACQVYDAGEFTGPSSASVLVMPHMLINSQYLHACEAGGVIRCGLQTRLDMGPHGIPRGCQLSSQSCDGGSFEAQLSDRPADRPHKRALGAHTRSSCSRNVTVWQVCSRHIQRRLATGTLPEPRPRVRRSPPPPRARGLERSPRIQGSQHSDHRTLCRASEHLGCGPRPSDGSPPNRRADHTDHNDQATQSSSR